MPLYEYFCSHCKQTIEILQNIDEGQLLSCPSCQEKTLKKKFSSIAIHQEKACDSCEASTQNSCSHTGECSCCH
jgi:putative FmdB family regulatory protein